MNIFDQYGIREAADVTISSIHKKKDGSGGLYRLPALFLDTSKVATTEESADTTWSQGGHGNSRLISWDSNKTINFSFEDALCTPASLGLCWGGILSAAWKDSQVNIETGLVDNCGVERISRFEKAFYPRNDGTEATVGNLLPRDGSEDVVNDLNGDPIYLQRSSIIDGVVIKGFGAVKGKPYRWAAEIESAVKSLAIVPDRFFSIYGKSYPIKRRQTVGINQPSESFKYEITYKRGYDLYNDTPVEAKIIYHKQNENKETTKACATVEEDKALRYLDDATAYPFLKVRVCLDGSIRVYLGAPTVDWDLTRKIEDVDPEIAGDGVAQEDYAWIDVTNVVDTTQFAGLDLWVRFDSINALSYYIITRYKDDIFSIGPKDIEGGLDNTVRPFANATYVATIDYSNNLTVKQGIEEVLEATPATLVYNTWYSKADFLDFFSGVTGFAVAFQMVLDQAPELEDKEAAVGSTDQFKIDRTGALYIKRTLATPSTVGTVGEVTGVDYSLTDSQGISEATGVCVPCCKKPNLSREIWAYVNPNTMTPYEDDYWFHQSEPYLKASLTLSTKSNPVNSQKIVVDKGTFPGVYTIELESYIRSRDTQEDQRIKITFPVCKIKTSNSFSMSPDGDPTVFKLDVEVAQPKEGGQMIIEFFDVEKTQKIGCGGKQVPKDGSTKITAQ